MRATPPWTSAPTVRAIRSASDPLPPRVPCTRGTYPKEVTPLRMLLRTDAPLRAAITAAFGPVFTPDGAMDRQKLGAAVFSDPAALDRLNAIIFDRLPRELLRRVNESDATMVGIDAINLVESGLSRLCRRTVAVLAPTETRVRRIMARDGISEDYARLRVQAQKPDEFYRAHCTDVLMNDAASPQVFEEIAYQRLQHIFEEEADHE